MVIVFVANNLDAGNVPGFSIMNFAEGLSRRGHVIRILTCGDEQPDKKNKDSTFEIYHASGLKRPFASLFHVTEVLDKALSGADAVHIFGPSMLGKAVNKAARRSGIPVVAGFYFRPENMMHFVYILLRWYFYRSFMHIHCLSKSDAAQLRAHGYKAWLHVVPIEHDSQENIARKMESVYKSLSRKQDKNEYARGLLFKLFSRLFHSGFAVPLMQFWMRVVLGARIRGKRNLRGLRGAVTVCNHVHYLDSVLVSLALFPRKATFPTFPRNVRTLWPGKVVKILGGVPVPEKITEVETFFDEMEFLLRKNHMVHFFPEGIVRPYYTGLRNFKKGAFHLAAHARVPIVPMFITFDPPGGIYRLIHRKPVMTLHVEKPVEPADAEPESDARLRMEIIHRKMKSFVEKSNL